MERESFEDAETAALMNRLYVCIKVDREERPDVDQIYMDTVVRMTGHGGWPLTVFCTPDGSPFYGGTYYPPEPRHGLPSFRQVLEAIERAYREAPDEVERTRRGILQALAARPSGEASQAPGAATVRAAAERLMRGADTQHGGFGGAPMFPTLTNLDLLLTACDVLPGAAAENALAHVVKTCHEMSRRGLFDHLGGGFHRYCVDAAWAIPHFEKMLYDNGQLLRTYAEAWRRSGRTDDDLVWPIRETVAWLQREMRGEEGAFFASQDADSEGEEGRFYVWTPAEIEGVLGEERAEAFCGAYGVTPSGNFEGGTTHLGDLTRSERRRFREERQELLEARQRRVAPATARKRLAAWNGLVVSGLARAGSLLGDADMLADATRAADFLLGPMRPGDRPTRIFDGERAAGTAFLDDLAALLEACLDLHRAGAGDRYLAAAIATARDVVARFFDPDARDLFLTPSDGEALIHRPRSDHDGATPHSSGLAALGLLRTAALADDPELDRVARSVIATHAYEMERVPHAHPTMARAAWLAERGFSLAVVVVDSVDPMAGALARRARELLAPDDGVVQIAPGAPVPEGLAESWVRGRTAVEGSPTAYLCRGTTCSLPICDPDDLAIDALD